MIALLLILLAVVGGAVAAWFYWPAFRSWVKDSETLLWARLQIAFGSLLAAAQQANIGDIFSQLGWAKWAGLAVLVMGLVTEFARRSRADDLK